MNRSSRLRRYDGSLRTRLIVGIAVSTLIILIGTTAVSYSLIQQSLYAEFDELLGAQTRSMALMIEQDGQTVEVEFANRPLPEFDRRERPAYFQVWLADGTLVARSRRLGNADLPYPVGTPFTPGVQPVTLPDGRSGRIAGLRFLPHVEGNVRSHSVAREDVDAAGPLDDRSDRNGVPVTARTPVVLVVARETADVDRVLTKILWLLCGSAIVAVGLIVGVLAWLVTRSLLPVSELARQISQLDEQSLTGRIDVADVPSELQPIITRLNGLIVRLETAFRREKTLTADLAHELRTPLAGIRSTLEVSLSRLRDDLDYRDAMQKSLHICAQTQQLVEALLALARMEAGRERVDRALIDVECVLHRCWKSHRHMLDDRRIHVTWDCQPGLLLNTDSTMLHVVVSNLIDNAVTYVDQGGQVEIASRIDGATYQLRVSNSGCRLTADAAALVFERFWRAEEARSATGLHAGLGLALCRRILTVLDGTIHVTVQNEQFEAAVVFGAELIEIVTNDDLDAVPEQSIPCLSPLAE